MVAKTYGDAGRAREKRNDKCDDELVRRSDEDAIYQEVNEDVRKDVFLDVMESREKSWVHVHRVDEDE